MIIPEWSEKLMKNSFRVLKVPPRRFNLVTTRSLVGMVVLAVAFSACFKAAEFPIVPEIEYNNVIFRKGPAPTKDVPSPADTLILTINFKDGDGDLGLDASETGIPYNDKYYYLFKDGSFLNYKAKRTIAGFDTLPDFLTPYNCTNWEQIRDQSPQPKVIDTLYFTLNPDHFNFVADIYVH